MQVFSLALQRGAPKVQPLICLCVPGKKTCFSATVEAVELEGKKFLLKVVSKKFGEDGENYTALNGKWFINPVCSFWGSREEQLDEDGGCLIHFPSVGLTVPVPGWQQWQEQLSTPLTMCQTGHLLWLDRRQKPLTAILPALASFRWDLNFPQFLQGLGKLQGRQNEAHLEWCSSWEVPDAGIMWMAVTFSVFHILIEWPFPLFPML